MRKKARGTRMLRPRKHARTQERNGKKGGRGSATAEMQDLGG